MSSLSLASDVFKMTLEPKSEFSDQQVTAAMNIAAVFAEKAIRYSLLKAECQAGKTGVFHKLIKEMLKSGEIQNAYILCGSSETDLRDQAKKDTLRYNPDAPINVIFRQDFKKVTMDITNALIVVDESHLDAGKDMEMAKFLRKHGISMDGNPMMLIKKNAYLVSVSATPYAEICAIAHNETPYPKHMETLVSGETYFGLSNYLYLGLMKPTFDLVNNRIAFTNLFTSAPKYALMRMTQGKHASKQEQAVTTFCKEKGYKVKYFTSEKSDILIDDLKNAPSVNTVIIIRGRLRAGKVVPKQHIAFVWEGAKSSDTAALVQGLPGRMCGYEFGEDKPLIFVPQSALKIYDGKLITASEINRAISCPTLIPRKVKFVVSSQLPSRPSDGTMQCPPIRLVVEADGDYSHDEEYLLTGDDTAQYSVLRENCFKLLKENRALVEDSVLLSSEQKNEIKEALLDKEELTSSDASTRFQYTQNHYANIIKAYETGTTPSENINDHRLVNFVLLDKRNYGVPGANKRHIYVIFYTKASAGVTGIMQAPLKSRIPKTNGKSHFSLQHADMPLVAGGLVGFNASNIKSPEALDKSIRDYVTLSLKTSLMVSRCIEGVGEEFKMQKAEFNYSSSKDNAVELLCKKISEDFHITLKIKYARSATDYFNIKKITW